MHSIHANTEVEMYPIDWKTHDQGHQQFDCPGTKELPKFLSVFLSFYFNIVSKVMEEGKIGELESVYSYPKATVVWVNILNSN